jgi:hypothetical protein
MSQSDEVTDPRWCSERVRDGLRMPADIGSVSAVAAASGYDEQECRYGAHDHMRK